MLIISALCFTGALSAKSDQWRADRLNSVCACGLLVGLNKDRRMKTREKRRRIGRKKPESQVMLEVFGDKLTKQFRKIMEEERASLGAAYPYSCLHSIVGEKKP